MGYSLHKKIKNLKKGWTLIELMIYLSLFSSAIVLFMRYETLGRSLTSTQFAKLDVLSSNVFSLEIITEKIKGGWKVNQIKENYLSLKMKKTSLQKVLILKRDTKKNILYMIEKNGKKSVKTPLGSFVTKFKCKKKIFGIKTMLIISLENTSLNFLGSEYKFNIKRKILLD